MLTRKTRANATITFAYDTLNRLITKTPPSPAPVVSYSYDLAGRLTGVSDTSAAITAAVPPAPNTPYATSYTYDARNRPVSAIWDPAPTAVSPAASSATFTHTYNQVNQRAGQSTTDNSWWIYPAAAPSTVSYTANALNQYTAVAAVTPTYDANGNLTSDGTFTFGYDAENRLVSASGPGLTGTYAYDAQGRRKSKTVNGVTTAFVTDADNREILEYDGTTGAVLHWYAYGLGSNDVLNQMNVAANARTTFIPDLQGSIIGTLDSATGTLTKRGYLPYGASASAAGAFAYTGQRIDPETSGLHYYRARMYAPKWGRFMQTDPIGYEGGINLYAYVGNDPLNLIDPLGLASTPGTPSIWSLLAPMPGAAATDFVATNTMRTLAVAAALPTVIAAGILAMTSTSTAGPERDEVRYVVRGGQNTADQFRHGAGVTIDSQGKLQGVSVQSFPNTSVQQLSQRQFVPHNQIGVTTLDIIRGAGGNVIASPTQINPYHSTLSGIAPEVAQQLFTPTIPNPNPRLR